MCPVDRGTCEGFYRTVVDQITMYTTTDTTTYLATISVRHSQILVCWMLESTILPLYIYLLSVPKAGNQAKFCDHDSS